MFNFFWDTWSNKILLLIYCNMLEDCVEYCNLLLPHRKKQEVVLNYYYLFIIYFRRKLKEQNFQKYN